MMAIVFLLHHGGEYCAAGWVVCGLLIVASMLRSASQKSSAFGLTTFRKVPKGPESGIFLGNNSMNLLLCAT